MSNTLTESFTTDCGQVVTAETIRNYICKNATDQEIVMFMGLCKAQNLNPFKREAYLIKFANAPAQQIVAKEVFLKRAYRDPNYEGFKAGIVIEKTDGSMEYREGTIKTAKEKLIGGWCEVYVKNRKHPIRQEVSMEEYSKGQSTWKQMPCVMIRKCAMVTALREAFPEDLGGMYDASEMGVEQTLPERPIEVGKASTGQKQGILKLASMKGLYSYDDKKKKDTSKLEEFCSSNGFDLQELKFEEVDELIDLLSKYEPKDTDNPIVDADFKEVEDKEDIEKQASFTEL